MKKYILNIDRLYAGDTSNSVLVSQVDKDFPILIPSLNDVDDKFNFFSKWQHIYPKFGSNVPYYKIDNDYIIEFNLALQQEFKESGHSELYMIDDTIGGIKPNTVNYDVEKRHMHSLNGKELDVGGNSSQLNVLFPFKKICQKSLSQNSLSISKDIDDVMERSRNITLQGKVSYQKCVQSVGMVGNNMYIMSPQVELNTGEIIHSNGITIVNGIGNQYVFPSTLTLFRNSSDSEFLRWFNKHDHSVVVLDMDQETTNPVSELRVIGRTSWELTYNGYWFPTIMGCLSDVWKIYADDYPTDGSIKMPDCDDFGILLNLYDSFISGQSRVVRLKLPTARIGWKLVFSSDIFNQNESSPKIKYRVFNGDKQVEVYDKYITINLDEIPSIQSYIDLKVEIVADVDYRLRNSNSKYSDNLKKTGVLLSKFRFVNVYNSEVDDSLTYGTYIDEIGITEQQKSQRFNEFWSTLATHKEKIPFQTVLETSMNNHLTNNIKFKNNYSTGDMYGDVFVTKNVFDPRYDMYLTQDNNIFKFDSREYIGIGDCSNQLSLFYKPMTIFSDSELNSTRTIRGGSDRYDELKYQMVEVVKNINKFESSIKHKSNVFSVVVSNSNLVDRTSDDKDIEKIKNKLRECVNQFVRNACKDIVPVHTQLFDVQFN